MIWCSHLFKSFPQFIVIHTVKGFGVVNEAEIDVFLELFCFFDHLANVGNKSVVRLIEIYIFQKILFIVLELLLQPVLSKKAVRKGLYGENSFSSCLVLGQLRCK